ncbi:MAG: tRNA pseudouridine(38-40) synthase TruA [Sphingobacteriales bacterium]|nr:MAG: tRNA pseudouridine(38-40) synthase TruA [Sphingobacteriales bacterium]TAF81463.1 MAG: tRNA pseudouridine(38-40) synthase TruA [Sphingobacteriales bacterium]
MPSIQRFFIEIAYKGTAYHGWQSQPNALAVQEVLNQKLSIIFKQNIETLGCGRTDAGVHATQFFAHFDVFEADITKVTNANTIKSINAILPPDIVAIQIINVDNQAHARFDATLRSYQYHIHFTKNPFKTNESWLLKYTHLDVDAMNQAAAIILTYNNFASFCKAKADNHTTICHLQCCEWHSSHNGLIFYITADRFLRNMVRAIVGTLLDVGLHKLKPEALHTIIQSKNRSHAGASVPACGLYLTKVNYKYINNGN